MQEGQVALGCPRCRESSVDTLLVAGAPLDGASCRRCGGVFVPASGSERLLHEELAIERAALVELSSSFGGRKLACPTCRGRMNSLLLRGVDVDVCLGCGGLWLDHGELSRLSGGRHVEPTVSVTSVRQARDVALARRPDGVVRIDARTPFTLQVGSVLRGTGLGLLGAALLGFDIVWGPWLGAALAMLGAALRWPRVVDVFPRARRLLRSRSVMPTDARDPRTERLDDRAVVVVRPAGRGSQASSSYDDACGRPLVPLGDGAAATVIAAANAHARRLGARVVLHRRFDEHATAGPASSFARNSRTLTLRRTSADTAFVVATAADEQGPLFTLTHAVPARGDETARERLQLCFLLQDTRGQRLRLHDDGAGNVVVVDGAGEAAAAVTERGPHWWSRASCALAQHATRLHLVQAVAGPDWHLVDDTGARRGRVDVDDGLTVRLDAALDDDERLCALLLVAFAGSARTTLFAR